MQSMLGNDNYSAVDMGELKDRFSTIMMFGKLANIGDDISSEYIADTSTLKKMVTGEVVKAEQKGSPAINFTPYAMHIYSAITAFGTTERHRYYSIVCKCSNS